MLSYSSCRGGTVSYFDVSKGSCRRSRRHEVYKISPLLASLARRVNMTLDWNVYSDRRRFVDKQHPSRKREGGREEVKRKGKGRTRSRCFIADDQSICKYLSSHGANEYTEFIWLGKRRVRAYLATDRSTVSRDNPTDPPINRTA